MIRSDYTVADKSIQRENSKKVKSNQNKVALMSKPIALF